VNVSVVAGVLNSIKLSWAMVYFLSDVFCLSAGYAFFLLIFHIPDQMGQQKGGGTIAKT
jgi:hypothetical protein